MFQRLLRMASTNTGPAWRLDRSRSPHGGRHFDGRCRLPSGTWSRSVNRTCGIRARQVAALALLVFCVLCTGCSILQNGTRTLITEPWAYCDHSHEHATHSRHLKLAESTWEDLQRCNPTPSCSPDHAQGFKDGFADYLDAGGNGEPPPLPPRRYWKSNYSTPEGHRAIEDWFAGFRHGAAVAARCGYRRFVTVPLAGPPGSAVLTCPCPPQGGVSPNSPPASPPQPASPEAATMRPTMPGVVRYSANSREGAATEKPPNGRSGDRAIRLPDVDSQPLRLPPVEAHSVTPNLPKPLPACFGPAISSCPWSVGPSCRAGPGAARQPAPTSLPLPTTTNDAC
jgi:hypothetical protein